MGDHMTMAPCHEVRRAGKSCGERRQVAFGAGSVLALMAVLALSLVACGTSGPPGAAQSTQTAGALQTAAAQATRAAAPVWTDIAVRQEGTVATSDVALLVGVTITNRTAVAIHVVHDCHYAPVIVRVWAVDGRGPGWTQDTSSCPLHPGIDDKEIAPGASYTYTYKADLSSFAAREGQAFHTGAYRVMADYHWHQGTQAQAEATPTLLYGEEKAETIITLQ
jgi:hypothetical protein